MNLPFQRKFLISFLFIESAIIILTGLIIIGLHFIINTDTLGVGLIILLFGIVNTSFTIVIAYCWRIYNDIKYFLITLLKLKKNTKKIIFHLLLQKKPIIADRLFNVCRDGWILLLNYK